MPPKGSGSHRVGCQSSFRGPRVAGVDQEHALSHAVGEDAGGGEGEAGNADIDLAKDLAGVGQRRPIAAQGAGGSFGLLGRAVSQDDFRGPGVDQPIGRRAGRPARAQDERRTSGGQNAAGVERSYQSDMIGVVSDLAWASRAVGRRAGLGSRPAESHAIHGADPSRRLVETIDQGGHLFFEWRSDIEPPDPDPPGGLERFAGRVGGQSRVEAVVSGLPEKQPEDVGAQAVGDRLSRDGEERGARHSL